MTVNRNDVWSRALEMLRFPLALLVIMEHVFVPNMFGDDVAPDSVAGAMILFVKVFISGQSVPVYFFISGFLFFLGYDLTMESYSRRIKTRFRSLFVPYMLWNVVAVIFIFLPLMPGMNHVFPNLDTTELAGEFSLSKIPEWFISSGGRFHVPADPAMWYVRNLMVVAVMTPLIGLLLRRFGGWVPFVLGLFWYVCGPLHIVNYNFAAAFFFFTLGAYMSYKRKDMTAEFRKWRTVSFTVYPVIGLLCLLWCFSEGNLDYRLDYGLRGNMYYLKNLAILAGIPFAYHIAAILIRRYDFKVHDILTSAAFFIYCAHQILLLYLPSVILKLVTPDTMWKTTACYVLLLAIVVAVLLGVYGFMRKVCPRFLMLFTGGRS